jgi:hypothetical protein
MGAAILTQALLSDPPAVDDGKHAGHILVYFASTVQRDNA